MYYQTREPMKITSLFYKEVEPDHPRAGKWVNLPEAVHPSWLFYGSRAEFLQIIESGQSPSPAGHIAMTPACSTPLDGAFFFARCYARFSALTGQHMPSFHAGGLSEGVRSTSLSGGLGARSLRCAGS